MSQSILIPRPVLKALLVELDMCHYMFGPIVQNDILPSDWFRALLITHPNNAENIRLDNDDVRRLVIRSTTALRGVILRLRERSDEHLSALRLLHVERGRVDSMLARNRELDRSRLLRFATSNARMDRMSAETDTLNLEGNSVGSRENGGDWLGGGGPSARENDYNGYSGHRRVELAAVRREGPIIRDGIDDTLDS
ncbi:hypothetical protein RBB50_000025 [Rhinocladiella similis]